MASIGHLMVGSAVGAGYAQDTDAPRRRLAICGFALLGLLPDLDLLGGVFGVSPDGPLGHRGLTHSLVFAAAVALLIALIAWGRKARPGPIALWTFLAVGSHGIVDMLSSQGHGPMLFWPFTTETWLFAWRPVPGVATASEYFSLHAIPTFLTEAVIFSPFLVYALWVAFRKSQTRRLPLVLGEGEEAASEA